MYKLSRCLVTLLLTVSCHSYALAQDSLADLNRRVQDMEWKLNDVRQRSSEQDVRVGNYAPMGLVLFLFGAFCALWAQNTGRNAWFWFFFGLILNVIAVIGILIINSNTNRANNS